MGAGRRIHLLNKIKSLIKVFRPGRDGRLTKLEFLKSIDTVYKELRILLAKALMSMDIDAQCELILNGFFFVFVACLVIWALGFDPLGKTPRWTPVVGMPSIYHTHNVHILVVCPFLSNVLQSIISYSGLRFHVQFCVI